MSVLLDLTGTLESFCYRNICFRYMLSSLWLAPEISTDTCQAKTSIKSQIPLVRNCNENLSCGLLVPNWCAESHIIGPCKGSFSDLSDFLCLLMSSWHSKPNIAHCVRYGRPTLEPHNTRSAGNQLGWPIDPDNVAVAGVETLPTLTI